MEKDPDVGEVEDDDDDMGGDVDVVDDGEVDDENR